ncbi:MAG: dihydroorotase, partial [Gammaproteobacteria bacterium]|nr:dihydroorotase [Gammaproteobacteria bacterium]
MTLSIARPDDFHLHLRDGDALADLVPPVAKRFARALVMPNLTPPVTTVAAAENYRDRILAAVPEGADFTPLMTLYLTETMPAAEIEQAAGSGLIHAAKLYPAGATTNSSAGVRDVGAIDPLFAAMQKAGLVLAIHGELADPNLDP